MKKLLIALLIILPLFVYSQLSEIIKPINMKNVEWKEIFTLANLDVEYVAQGIEIYKDYLLFTVHKADKKSILLVFNIKESGELIHLFSTDFPEIATHVSDLSIYQNTLYGIDYASNNLYEIDIDKTIEKKRLVIINEIPTHLKRSGSIIVSEYKNKKTLFVSQFIISNKISVYSFDNLTDKQKKPLLEINAKHYIQGLYEKNDLLYVSSNKYGTDPIFIINKKEMIKKSSINIPSTVAINSPGKMVEDIVVFDDYIITSDEETNTIYISKSSITDILTKEK
jgi:hypothetical protein